MARTRLKTLQRGTSLQATILRGMAARTLLLTAVTWLAIPLPFPVAGQEATGGPDGAIPDSVRRHMAEGRFWKASLGLRSSLAPLESASLADRLLLAEAEAGWKNWDGAIAALTAGGIDTAQMSDRFWYMLGAASQAAGDEDGAAQAFQRLGAEPEDSREALVARSFLARRLVAVGQHGEAALQVEELAALAPEVAAWTALSAARTLAEAGHAEQVSRFLALVADPVALRSGWSLEADAWAAADDTAQALEALRNIRPDLVTGAARVGLKGREWRYRLALGDSAGAVAAMEDLLHTTTAGSEALAAANAHWKVARNSGPEILKLVATAFGRSAEFGLAVRAWRVAVRAGAVLTESEKLALARAYNGSNDRGSAVEVYRELQASENQVIGAAALRAWATIRTRQGRHGDSRILQERLIERYPSSPQAVDVVFFRGEDHRNAGRLNQAIEEYRDAASMSHTDRSGLARMRWAQIHLSREEHQEAVQVFADYLEAYPNGRRWEEASFWLVRAARAAGDTVGARDLLDRLHAESPLSYYAHLAAEGEGAPPSVHLEPVTGPPPPLPDWLDRDLEVLATLDEAGLMEGAEVHVAGLKSAVRDSTELMLGLARAFNHNGRTIDGIRLGLELRERGEEWSRALLEVVYPFPYRALIMSRAEELGLDPYLVAGLIRQESAFVPAIGSSAGAIGLMQIMPATGRQLARALGPRGYRTESLRTAEVNVHLGTQYLAELMERYSGDIPIVLSAYNAGPTRANRWRRFPEAEDPHRFTERIPFVETRGYVKNVVRNRALYRWLYGSP